jgi:hypothetical protein
MKSFVAVFEKFESAFDSFVKEKKSKKDKLFAKTDNIPENGIKAKTASKVGAETSRPGKTIKLGGNKKSA